MRSAHGGWTLRCGLARKTGQERGSTETDRTKTVSWGFPIYVLLFLSYFKIF